MKTFNLLLGFTILLLSFHLSAQKRLTNREIYNFEVGDVIHTSYYVFGVTTEYVKRKIDSKWVSTDLDTFYFEVNDSVYRYSPPKGWELSVEKKIISFFDLDSFPKFKYHDSLFQGEMHNLQTDSINGLVKNEYYISSNRNSAKLTCIESSGMYYEFNGYVNIVLEQNKLLYFNRSNQVIIGEPIGSKLEERQLLNHEIYNYEIGDVFHFESIPSSGPPSYTKRKVIGKTENSSDSITYSLLDSNYSMVLQFDPYPYYQLHVNQYLAGYLKHQVPIESSKVENFTSFFDTNLNTQTNKYHKHLVDGVVDEATYYEGIGRVVAFYYYNRGAFIGGYSRLIYYKKGDKVYGKRIGQLIEDDIDTTQDNIQDIGIEFQVFPSPVSDILYVSGENLGWYMIRDLMGRTVLSANKYENGINVYSLSPGIYSIMIRSNREFYSSKFIKR